MSSQVTPTSSHESELQRRLEGMPKVSSLPILWFALAVVVVWTAGIIPWAWQYGAWPWELPFGIEKGKAAEFGDSFGFINSLISSLALVGVIAAIWLQKKELEEQRRVMIYTQYEMEQSTKAHEDSRKELAKQARISLQATILTALQGIEQSAANPVIYPQEEGKNTALFVDQLRQLLVVDILSQDENQQAVAEELSARLARWKNLTFTMNTCREARNWVDRLINDGHDYQTGQRRIKIAPDNIEQTQYEMLLYGLESKLDRLKKAMAACGQSSDVISEWVTVAKEKESRKDIADLIDRLNGLRAECEKQEDEAMYLRLAMFA